jgi:hypothetical protein
MVFENSTLAAGIGIGVAEAGEPNLTKNVAKEEPMSNQFQVSRTALVTRKSLKEHPLNPRSITPQARARLKAGIQKFGIIGSAFIVNERTGFLLGGHQRLAVLDDLQGGKNYEVKVDFIDVSEAEEKEILVLLNNQSAAGQWDEYALLNIVSDPEVDQAILGFSETERMHFEALLKESDKDADEAAKYLSEATEDYEALRGEVAEESVKAEEVAKRETKKQTWEKTVEELMPPPPPREGANTQKDSAFREARESWKKQPIEELVIVRFIFTSTVHKTKWMKTLGLAGDYDSVHEKELPDQSWLD